MNIKEYSKQVKRTLNTDLNYREKMSMLCMGIAGETGELIDLVKKSLYHKHSIALLIIKKEIGDIIWYLINLCNEFSIDMEQIFDINIEKLKQRYLAGFDFEKSKNKVED